MVALIRQARLSTAFSPYRCRQCGGAGQPGSRGCCATRLGCWVIRDRGRPEGDRVIPGKRFRTRAAAMMAMRVLARALAGGRGSR